MSTPTAEELVAQAQQAWRDETDPKLYNRDGYEEHWLAQRLATALADVERLRAVHADLGSTTRLEGDCPGPSICQNRISDLRQRAEAAEEALAECRGLLTLNIEAVESLKAKLAAAQQREAWWRELYDEEDQEFNARAESERGCELRRLLGLDAAT